MQNCKNAALILGGKIRVKDCLHRYDTVSNPRLNFNLNYFNSIPIIFKCKFASDRIQVAKYMLINEQCPLKQNY